MERLSGSDPADQAGQLLQMIRIRNTVYSRPVMAATVELLNAETAADAPGMGKVVTRLADVLLAQAGQACSRWATGRSPPRSSPAYLARLR
jgi:hypothetical protein